MNSQQNQHELDYYTPFSKTLNSQKIKNFKEELEPLYVAPSNSVIGKYSKMFFGSKYSFGLGNSNLSEFPWHNKVIFSAIKEQKILNILKEEEIDLYDVVISDYLDHPKSDTSLNLNGMGVGGVVDLFNLIEQGNSEFSNEDMVILPNYEKRSSMEKSSARWAASFNLRSTSLLTIRNLEQLYDGENAEYEYLFFKIEKYLGVGTNGSPIQTYIVGDTTGDVILSDTQVNTRGTYTYLVKAYALIHGSGYSYRLIGETNDTEVSVAEIQVSMRPSLKIVELPFFKKQIVVTKKPPIPPFVKFINKSNSKNTVRVLLDLQRGEQLSKFISVTPEDSSILNLITGASTGKNVEFEYSNNAGKYEIFKSFSKIKNYNSYDTSFISENKNGNSHIVLNERMRPNKKYYYFFRTINNFDLPSNPSPIYEVELVKDADDSKVLVSIVEFENDEDKIFQPDHKFGQFMHISPAFMQVQLEFPQEYDDDTYKKLLPKFNLGYADESVWGRKFKFRITSNNTGRKIDFNIIFDIVKRESEENLK